MRAKDDVRYPTQSMTAALTTGSSSQRIRVLLSIDAGLLDIYTAAAAEAGLDRNSVFAAALYIIAASKNRTALAVAMARRNNGNTNRGRRIVESWEQRRRQKR